MSCNAIIWSILSFLTETVSLQCIIDARVLLPVMCAAYAIALWWSEAQCSTEPWVVCTVQCAEMNTVLGASSRPSDSYAITITAQLRIRKSHNQQPAWSLWPWRSGGNVIDPWKNTRTQPNPHSLGFHCRQVCASNQRSIDCYQEMPCVQAHRWPLGRDNPVLIFFAKLWFGLAQKRNCANTIHCDTKQLYLGVIQWVQTAHSVESQTLIKQCTIELFHDILMYLFTQCKTWKPHHQHTLRK